jgi:hypothetical protein
MREVDYSLLVITSTLPTSTEIVMRSRKLMTVTRKTASELAGYMKKAP